MTETSDPLLIKSNVVPQSNHALLGAGSRLLKADSEMMRSNHRLLAITARLGIAA